MIIQKNTKRSGIHSTSNLEAKYQYELAKRSGFGENQLPAAAAAGDAEAIAACAGAAMAALDTGTRMPGAIHDWLTDILGQMYGDTEPNVAFGWTRKGQKHRRPEFGALRKKVRIVRAMKALIDADPPWKLDAAALNVAKQFSVSEETAKTYYKNRKKG